MVGIKHHTPAAGRGIKIAKSSYNEEHDPGAIADVLTDHDLAAHTALGLAVEGSANATTLDGIDSTGFALAAKGVTNGDTHDHSGGDGAQINHTTLSNIGTNTHAQIDTHIAAVAPHSGHEATANKGTSEGYAPLDENSKVPNINLPIGYGETKLWNTTLNDVPAGWHVCDGTNGTPDLSTVEPQASTTTDYIMYIGGETVTARTINITNSASSVCSFVIEDVLNATITAIEDGAPFFLIITNTDAGAIELHLKCSRTSDGYTIFSTSAWVGGGTIYLGIGNSASLMLTQYLDCTWTIAEASA